MFSYSLVPPKFYGDVCTSIVQAYYSQPDGGFFLTETFTAYDLFLQILKSKPAYFTKHLKLCEEKIGNV
jgi:hypothetical protein